MLKNKFHYFLIFFFNFLLGQGITNGFGLGSFLTFNGSINATAGLTELAPSFQKEVSLTNPTTWQDLKFTYLSVSYAYNLANLNNSSTINEFSNLSDISWIIPIKSKTSIGLSLSPYSNQKINAVSKDSLVFYAFEDTLKTINKIERFGGIMSFKVGGSRQVSDKLTIGTQFNFLFGSGRYDEIIQFKSSPSVIINTRHRYAGLLSANYVSFKINEQLNLYGKYSFPLNPLNVAVLNRPIFEDTNGNNYHDYTTQQDFPHPDSLLVPNEDRLDGIHKPSEYSIAVEYKINSRSFLSTEMTQLSEAGNYELIKTPMNNSITKLTTQKLQFTQFNDDLSLEFFDKFISRIGVQAKTISMDKNQLEIKEIALSLGVGFKFKKMGNQIDLNYYYGNRIYKNTQNKEIFQQFQLSTSLADLWFVKRRQK